MKKRILIVEDVEFNRELLEQVLEDDYETLTAIDGAAGVELARRERPDLILMDMSLPVVDGWEATRRLKAGDVTKHVPIIALTGNALAGHDERARKAGCDSYLTKPCLPESVEKEIRRVIGLATFQSVR